MIGKVFHLLVALSFLPLAHFLCPYRPCPRSPSPPCRLTLSFPYIYYTFFLSPVLFPSSSYSHLSYYPSSSSCSSSFPPLSPFIINL